MLQARSEVVSVGLKLTRWRVVLHAPLRAVRAVGADLAAASSVQPSTMPPGTSVGPPPTAIAPCLQHEDTKGTKGSS